MKRRTVEPLSFAAKSKGTHVLPHGFVGGSRHFLRPGTVLLALLFATGLVLGASPKSGTEPVMLVVMDPLAKELACSCVKGYAQRDYRKFAAQLKSALKQPVNVEFSDDLAESLAGVKPGREIIVVGGQSLVVNGGKKGRAEMSSGL